MARSTARIIGRGAVLAARASLAAARLLRRGGARPDRVVVPEGRRVELPGRGRTFVIDLPGPSDDAPVLLLFHGIGTTAHLTWFTALNALAERYRVVTFDQRWHGRGIRSDRFQLDDCADDAAALLDVLDLDRVTIVGYSMGGALAQVFYSRHPGRVAGMVLCSTAMRWSGNLADRAFFLLLRGINLRLRTTARDRVHATAAGLTDLPDPLDGNLRRWAVQELATTSLWAVPEVLAELGRYDSTRWMQDVSVPTAVVITARDRAIPPARQRDLARTIPDAIVAEAPGGHTSIALDTRRWLPIFLDAVDSVT